MFQRCVETTLDGWVFGLMRFSFSKPLMNFFSGEACQLFRGHILEQMSSVHFTPVGCFI